jgi:integrase
MNTLDRLLSAFPDDAALDQAIQRLEQAKKEREHAKAPSENKETPQRSRKSSQSRGVFEKERGSDQWWIRYVDSTGRLRRELAGSKGDAIDLYRKRKAEALQGKKLPEKLRRRVVHFSELCEDFRKHSVANNEGHKNEGYRISQLKAEFGERPAETIPIEHFRNYFDRQEWAPGTFNRTRTVLFSIYRLGMENNKIIINPAKLLKRKKVHDDRVRFLNQFEPLPTEIDYLKPLKGEEERLRAVISRDWPEQHMDEFEIALQSGMRCKEQFTRIDWSCVDLTRKDLRVPQSKNGLGRHIPLNVEARAAFQRLLERQIGDGPTPIISKGPIFVGKGGERLLGARHWFLRATRKAGLENFTWHDLRHTFASRLVMADVDIRTVAELLGHKNIQMTMRYAHLAPAHKLVAVERLSRYNS